MNNEELNKIYKLDDGYAEEFSKSAKEYAKDFNKDIEKYFNEFGSPSYIKVTEENILNYYVEYIICNPGTFVVISNLFYPNEKESNELLFKVIAELLNKNYNIDRRYNKIRIINE